MKILFPLRERERTFLQSLFEYGTIDAALATDDRNLIEKINAHPLLQWKGLEAKRKMLGSIFPAKLIFQDGKYRTDGLNPALAIILQKSNGLQKEKTGNIVISENVSGDVPSTGTFSNQFLEGMKQLYELEPFIKVKPYLTNQWEKNNSKIKRAS